MQASTLTPFESSWDTRDLSKARDRESMILREFASSPSPSDLRSLSFAFPSLPLESSLTHARSLLVDRYSYIFFEKLRILNGKPKTAARKKAEAELGS